MKHVMKFTSYVTIALAILCVVVATYWLVSPRKVLTFNQPKATIYPSEIVPGGRAIVAIDYCKYADLDAILKRELVPADESYHLDLGDARSHVLEGCHVVEVPIKIPDIAQPGLYFFKFGMTYDVNPIRSESYTYTSEVFEITEKK